MSRWLLIALLMSSAASAAVRVQLPQGLLEGESQGKVTTFFGIPYAAPPVGPLRFRPPQAAPSWSGVRSALDMGPACPQLIDADPTENNDAVMAEDCLTVNVWTPRADDRKRPVMVWIHGGAFVVGSSRNTFYDGANLAAHGDVVVVSLNYRLGAWGFLDLEDAFGPDYAGTANLALQDQIAALTWVQHNIAHFGGDPTNVTVFGESAGASSVGSLLSLPQAHGLFSRAILESGVPSQRPVEDRRRLARLTAGFLQAAGVSTPEELAAKPMQALLDAQEQVFNKPGGELGTFVPWIDGTVIKERPFTVVTEGRGNRVPILIGTTAEEMRYFSTAEDLGIEQKSQNVLLQQLQTFAGDHAAQILATYQRLYPYWGDMVVQIASDAIMRMPSVELAERTSVHQPIYMYLFTYRSTSTYKNFGSAHAMEIPFVFGVEDRPEVIVFSGRDPRRHQLAHQVMDRWVAFARTGDPTVKDGPRWLPYDAQRRFTMELGFPIRAVNDPLSEQRAVWANPMPQVQQGSILLRPR
jgi:para-nitrobenzyl esterase